MRRHYVSNDLMEVRNLGTWHLEEGCSSQEQESVQRHCGWCV